MRKCGTVLRAVSAILESLDDESRSELAALSFAFFPSRLFHLKFSLYPAHDFLDLSILLSTISVSRFLLISVRFRLKVAEY